MNNNEKGIAFYIVEFYDYLLKIQSSTKLQEYCDKERITAMLLPENYRLILNAIITRTRMNLFVKEYDFAPNIIKTKPFTKGFRTKNNPER